MPEYVILGEHTGLPPIRVGLHPDGGTYRVWSFLERQQRAKWQLQWQRHDSEDLTQQDYKHYEWQLRAAIRELEAREQQLRKAIAFLTPEQLEAICPQPTR
jgi:enoyl-CoA hydratase/carnithine racemase